MARFPTRQPPPTKPSSTTTKTKQLGTGHPRPTPRPLRVRRQGSPHRLPMREKAARTSCAKSHKPWNGEVGSRSGIRGKKNCSKKKKKPRAVLCLFSSCYQKPRRRAPPNFFSSRNMLKTFSAACRLSTLAEEASVASLVVRKSPGNRFFQISSALFAESQTDAAAVKTPSMHGNAAGSTVDARTPNVAVFFLIAGFV